MSITRIYCDNWTDGKDEGTEVINPTWKTVEEMILSLDGENKTLITFGDDDEGFYMAIGGGNGLYIAYLSYDDEEIFYNLVNEEIDNEELVELVVGGQMGRYEAKSCVSLESVLIAAKTFYENQKPDSGLNWNS